GRGGGGWGGREGGGGGGGGGGARWLHGAARHREPACDQREPLQKHRLRSGKGFRADRSDWNPDQRALPQSVGAGGIARRVDRLRESQSRQAQLRLGRKRHAGAS